MYPLKNWTTYKRGYRFLQPTSYSAHHLGTDILCPSGTPVYAPFSGTAVFAPFAGGGNVINLTCVVDGQVYVMRFMHLMKTVKLGNVNAGDQIAVSDNTGTQTTGAHLHVDISKNKININVLNNFVDPDTFNWNNQGGPMALQDIKIKDIPEIEFNKFHDIANSQYPGWTKEIYNKNQNAFLQYQEATQNGTLLDMLNYMENKPDYIAMRKNLQDALTLVPQLQAQITALQQQNDPAANEKLQQVKDHIIILKDLLGV